MDLEQLRREVEEGEQRLEPSTPEVDLFTASMLREVKPMLKTARAREIAEEMAQEFEQHAAQSDPSV